MITQTINDAHIQLLANKKQQFLRNFRYMNIFKNSCTIKKVDAKYFVKQLPSVSSFYYDDRNKFNAFNCTHYNKFCILQVHRKTNVLL